MKIKTLDTQYSTTQRLTEQVPVIEKYPDDKPLISIITVVFNGEKHLEETILSVIQQSYDNVEYIIIDGGSTDGTLDIIKKHEGQIDHWVSERDEGIYDAMNKGIDLVSGDWVNFMNAGDGFYSKSSIAELIEYVDLDIYSLIAGGHSVFFANQRKIVDRQTVLEVSRYPLKMPFCHQSLLARTDLLKKFPFDLSYEIAADFNFFYSCIISGEKIKLKQKIVSVVSSNGVSDIKRYETWLEYREIVKNQGVKGVLVEGFYLGMLFLEFVKVAVKLLIRR